MSKEICYEIKGENGEPNRVRVDLGFGWAVDYLFVDDGTIELSSASILCTRTGMVLTAKAPAKEVMRNISEIQWELARRYEERYPTLPGMHCIICGVKVIARDAFHDRLGGGPFCKIHYHPLPPEKEGPQS